MKTFYTIAGTAVLLALIGAALMWGMSDYLSLPVVHKSTSTGLCVKVETPPKQKPIHCNEIDKTVTTYDQVWTK